MYLRISSLIAIRTGIRKRPSAADILGQHIIQHFELCLETQLQRYFFGYRHPHSLVPQQSLPRKLRAERRVGHTPLQQELGRTIVLLHTARRFHAEMINTAIGQSLIVADATKPKLGRKVRITVHTRRILHAVTAHQIPHVAMHDVERRGSACPVVNVERLVLFQQFLFAERGRRIAEISFYTAQERLRLDERSGQEEVLRVY